MTLSVGAVFCRYVIYNIVIYNYVLWSCESAEFILLLDQIISIEIVWLQQVLAHPLTQSILTLLNTFTGNMLSPIHLQCAPSNTHSELFFKEQYKHAWKKTFSIYVCVRVCYELIMYQSMQVFIYVHVNNVDEIPYLSMRPICAIIEDACNWSLKFI